MFHLKPGLLHKKKKEEVRIPHDEKNAVTNIAQEIIELLPESVIKRPIVFVCIGTDRSTGDSLGPLIGTLLKEKAPNPFYVYGSLDEPIHALNLAEKITEIQTKHLNPFIIGIDACLGRLKSIGVIQIGYGPVKPGSGVNKELPDVGDIHITGIVNVSGFMEYFVLQNTRLHLVMEMAKTISEGIYCASNMYNTNPSFSQLQWTINQDNQDQSN